ncbi:hypothetical protein PVAP13_8KG216605 [Panicum virgatum]|uniref:Uncharacterized protein n=1 Tax=Panicum virgatum TaxID=38727 RepID=A0A8T0PIE0_PANVG|nr:hypothetical protein PVAP13_8KG216605 [Panicum virgatum]
MMYHGGRNLTGEKALVVSSMAGEQKLTVNQIADDSGHERVWNLEEKKEDDEEVPFYLLLASGMYHGGRNLVGKKEGSGRWAGRGGVGGRPWARPSSLPPPRGLELSGTPLRWPAAASLLPHHRQPDGAASPAAGAGLGEGQRACPSSLPPSTRRQDLRPAFFPPWPPLPLLASPGCAEVQDRRPRAGWKTRRRGPSRGGAWRGGGGGEARGEAELAGSRRAGQRSLRGSGPRRSAGRGSSGGAGAVPVRGRHGGDRGGGAGEPWARRGGTRRSCSAAPCGARGLGGRCPVGRARQWRRRGMAGPWTRGSMPSPSPAARARASSSEIRSFLRVSSGKQGWRELLPSASAAAKVEQSLVFPMAAAATTVGDGAREGRKGPAHGCVPCRPYRAAYGVSEAALDNSVLDIMGLAH